MVRVGTDSAGRGGAYTLRVISGAPQRPIAVGQVVTGSLQGNEPQTSDGPLYYPYYYQDWAVTPTRADSLVIRMSASMYAPRLALGTVDGTAFHEVARARGDGGGIARLAVVPKPGRRYVVRIGGTNQDGLGGIGTFTLHVGAGADTVGTLLPEFGGVMSRVSPGWEMENWRLVAADGDGISIQVDSLAFATAVQVGTMEGDEFRVVAQREGAARSPTRLVITPIAGREYQIRVRSKGNGPYTLRVSRPGAAAEESATAAAPRSGSP